MDQASWPVVRGNEYDVSWVWIRLTRGLLTRSFSASHWRYTAQLGVRLCYRGGPSNNNAAVQSIALTRTQVEEGVVESMSDEKAKEALRVYEQTGAFMDGMVALREAARVGMRLPDKFVQTPLLACAQDGAREEDYPIRLRLDVHPHFRHLGQNKFRLDEYLHLPTLSVMVLVPSGEFMMGTPEDQEGNDDERPYHKVEIPYENLIQKYPLTQLNWTQLKDKNPSRFKGEDGAADEVFWFVNGEPYTGNDAPDPKNEAAVKAFQEQHVSAVPIMCKRDADGRPYAFHPVENVSWLDCRDYAKEAGLDFLSEAEWEYMARAGTTARFIYGDDEAALQRVAVYGRRWEDGHTAVGTKEPNPWGLFDVIGLVWEWVKDEYHDSYKDAPADGSAWTAEWEERKKQREAKLKRDAESFAEQMGDAADTNRADAKAEQDAYESGEPVAAAATGKKGGKQGTKKGGKKKGK